MTSRVLTVALIAPLALVAPTMLVAKKVTPAAASVKRGLALAKVRCAGCHGVTANSTSPNPEAPPWEDVVNRPGTTQRTLYRFLRDSHNYPEAMQFTIEPHHIRDISAYLITLQRPGYRPGI